MKTYSPPRLIAGFVILILLFAGYNAIQSGEDILLDDQNLPYCRSNWMGHLPDTLCLSQVTIPGTHNAGADKHTSQIWWLVEDYVICQNFRIKNQLKLGIRWLDIRLRYHNGSLLVHHGPFYLRKNFSNILDCSSDFLENHPSEVIILMIKQEHSKVSSYKFSEAVYTGMKDHGLHYFYRENKIPTVGEARGKIYIVRRFVNETGKDLGIYVYWPNNTTGSMYHYNGYSIYAQDHYSLRGVSTDKKFDLVVDCIKKAHNNTDPNTFYINFVSGERIAKGEALWETAHEINYRVKRFLEGDAKDWHHCGVIIINFAGGRGGHHKDCAPYLVEQILLRNPGIPDRQSRRRPGYEHSVSGSVPSALRLNLLG